MELQLQQSQNKIKQGSEKMETATATTNLKKEVHNNEKLLQQLHQSQNFKKSQGVKNTRNCNCND